MLIRVRHILFQLREGILVAIRYYTKGFWYIDAVIASMYWKQSPYQIQKKFSQESHCLYGPTPLTTWDRIATITGITAQDVVYDLGAGTGRGLFWLAYFVRCKVVGVEINPIFVTKAVKIQKYVHRLKFQLIQSHLLQTAFDEATVVYCYGICFTEDMLASLTTMCRQLQPGTKIITVGFSLAEYDSSLQPIKKFQACYPWGKATVYLHRM